ncbi:MAG: hypothetical protein KAU62_15190 [Candidatus Heimdallarchaeota archaeon]|nr:hypothetical protein [Candidatus Heimdallarchaeota archaeon]MCG3257446.1 hypothetical protein [Candidatus Heimdallarchaeota archaeon]MCK4612499.1 hypothetical protein [Candidatus Heimdallarchaeota archaeon]
MNSLQFPKKIEFLLRKSFHKVFLPYLFASISIIVLAVLERGPVAFVTGLVCLLPIILRVTISLIRKFKKEEPEQHSTDWRELRKQLTLILSKSKILLDTAVELRSEEVSNIILSEDQVNGNFFEENEELIRTIRNIGINGLLCLLFLIQQQPAIAAVKAIQRSLKIPLATAYRQLQKLSEMKLANTYYEPDKPSKALYKITDEGSSLIIQLYELIGDTLLPFHDTELAKTQVEAET